MPVVVTQVNNNWDYNGKSLCFKMLENIQKKLILKKTHSSISDLEMRTCNTLYYSLHNIFN